MLEGNLTVTSREHRYFFAVTSLGLLLRIIEISVAVIFPRAESGTRISFGIYSIFDHWELMSPLYCIVAFLACLPLAWRVSRTNLIVSVFPLSLLTYFFDYWFIDSQFRIREAAVIAPDYEFKTFDFLLLDGSIFDTATFLLVNVLVVWHVRLLGRLFRRES